jgi:hypothetical protein
LDAASQAQVTAGHSWLGTDPDADSYNATFDGNVDTLDSEIFTTIVAGNYVDTYTDTGAGHWRTFSMYDTVNVVWANEVRENNRSYKNTTVDYQILVPEDGTAEDVTATNYYMWVELE